MRVTIDISNYEEYALDFIEGQLSDELQDAFNAFLVLHPEIADEIEEMRSVEALDSSYALSAEQKESLKIKVTEVGPITSENYEEAFASSVDNEMDAGVENALPAFLSQNPSLHKDFDLYQKAVLKPDMNVGYGPKGGLKRSIPLWENTTQIITRVAAVLIVLLGTYTIWTAVQSEVYIPRNETLDFTLMDIQPVSTDATPTEIKDEVVQTETAASQVTKPGRIERSAPEQIASMQPISPSRINEAKPLEFENREMIAYVPINPDEVESPYQQKAAPSEMNLAQFVGQRVLGVDPAKTPTTKSLIREGAIKAIDSRENMSLTASAPKEEKKTIQFLAGNFEFKRVNYK